MVLCRKRKGRIPKIYAHSFFKGGWGCTSMSIALFLAGLCIALTAAALLFFDIIEPGPAAVIGIVGIGLIGTSGMSHIRRL